LSRRKFNRSAVIFADQPGMNWNPVAPAMALRSPARVSVDVHPPLRNDSGTQTPPRLLGRTVLLGFHCCCTVAGMNRSDCNLSFRTLVRARRNTNVTHRSTLRDHRPKIDPPAMACTVVRRLCWSRCGACGIRSATIRKESGRALLMASCRATPTWPINSGSRVRVIR